MDSALRIVGGLVAGCGLLSAFLLLLVLGSVSLGASVAVSSVLLGIAFVGLASVIEEQKRTNQILMALFDQYQAQICAQNEAAVTITNG